MEKTKYNVSPGDSAGRNSDGSDREDPNREEGYKKFARDKRKRIVRVEKNPRAGESQDDTAGQPVRRSFNPNFNEDNTLKGRAPSREYPRRDDFNREGGYDRRSDDRSRGQERPYVKEVDFRKLDNYGKDPDFNRDPSYKRPQSTERRDYDRKPSYGGRPDSRDSHGARDTRDNREGGYKPRQDGDRPQYGQGSYGNRPQRGDSGYGGRPQRSEGGAYGNRPRNNEGGAYGNRPQRDGYKGAPRQGKPQRQATPDYAKGSYPKFERGAIEGEIRLNRFLSMSGISSRREADEFIKAGQVTVNGQVVTELGTKVTRDDVVKYNDKVIKGESKVYILMNKPKGFVTSLDDPHAEKTVIDLIKNVVTERVYPVGRLDKNSMGVLLITNDGDMTKKLTHPSFNKKKIYQVSLDKALTKADMQKIADGIELEDGEIHADQINYVGESRKEIGIEIHSGRNRIIRRIFDHLGYTVQKLDRVYFAGLTKKNLKRGAWRFLTPREVDTLHNGKYE